LSTRIKEREEKILQLLQYLAIESSKGTPIIVEGRKDTETLRALGVEGKVIPAKSGGKSLLDVITEIEKEQPREVILLLDYDRRGKELTGRLRRYLETARITPNTTFRRELFHLVGKEVKDIESLVSYLDTLRKKVLNPA
jgi:5S rRNA maturation endonuclease (ribonuclease M5)